MVARADASRDELLRRRRAPTQDVRDPATERARLMADLDVLAVDFGDAPDQVGRYLAELELRGVLGPADEDPIYAHLQDTAGLAFADEVFRRTDLALATPEALLAEIQADAGLGKSGTAAPLDPDAERAKKTAEILDALGPQLDLDTRPIQVHSDAAARDATHAHGLYGLMRDGEVFLDPDRYDPTTQSGRRLLAHEVVHLAQRENHLRGARTLPSLPAAEREAETLSARFAAGERTGAPLAALTAYDQAACGSRALHDTPDKPTPDKPKEGRTEVVHEPPVYRIVDNQIEVPTIHYKVDKDAITETEPSAQPLMKQLADTLAAYPEITKIKIEGFTSTTASAEHNLALSQRRADRARAWLKDNEHVAHVVIETKGWGEDTAHLKEHTEDNVENDANRRTEFTIVEVDGAAVPSGWQPTKRVLVAPGKTIVRHLDAHGNVVREEVIPDGAPATTAARGPTVQAKAGPGGVRADGDGGRIPFVTGAGEPLPERARELFASAFGRGFDGVRIHRNSPEAAALGALAFARGREIHFAAGRFDPSGPQGLALIGHELAHLVQQDAGRVGAGGGAANVNADPGLEAEADLLGQRAARGEHVGRAHEAGMPKVATDPMGAAEVVQRTPDPAAAAEPPAAEATAAEAPKAEAPKAEAPKDDAPKDDADKSDAQDTAGQETDAEDAELSPLRRELVKLFAEYQEKVVGDSEFEFIQKQTEWDELKAAEAEKTTVFNAAKSKYEADLKAWQALPKAEQQKTKKPMPPTPVAKTTTCIKTQAFILAEAFKRAKLKLANGGKRFDFATEVEKVSGKVNPEAWHLASPGSAERPKVGDIFVLAFRGSKVDLAAATVNYTRGEEERRVTAVGKATTALDAATTHLAEAKTSAEAALAAMEEVEGSHTQDARTKAAAYRKAKSALEIATNVLNAAKKTSVDAAKALKEADLANTNAQTKLDEARANAEHGARFEFSHVGFLAAEPIVESNGTETWWTFDGGQKVHRRKDTEGSEKSKRTYDPKTNEISGEKQQGGEARWLQGWIDVDLLPAEDPAGAPGAKP